MPIEEALEENDVRDILREFLTDEGMEDAEIHLNTGSKLGDGFLSVTNAIEVHHGGTVVKLFVKAAPKAPELRSALISKRLFEREIYYYAKIRPILDDFLREKLGEELDLQAKCFAVSTVEYKEALVFENLKEQGYRLYGKSALLTYEHTLLVLRSFARFHATFYALKDQRPDTYKGMVKDMSDITPIFIETLKLNDLVADALKTLREDDMKRIKTCLLDKIEEKVYGVSELISQPRDADDPAHIVVQGDCWINNMVFKYEGNDNEPTGIRLLDYQVCRIGVPVCDLIYFFYCSASTPEHLAKLDYFLRYYHEHLTAFAQKLGTEVAKFYPYRKLQADWKVWSSYGLYMVLCVVKIALSEQSEIPKPDEHIKSGKETNAFGVNLANNDAFFERLQHVVEHFDTNNFI